MGKYYKTSENKWTVTEIKFILVLTFGYGKTTNEKADYNSIKI